MTITFYGDAKIFCDVLSNFSSLFPPYWNSIFFKTFVILGLFLSLWVMVRKYSLSAFFPYLFSVFLGLAFIIPSVEVVIQDRISSSWKSPQVCTVRLPIGPSFLFSLASNFSDYLTRVIGVVFPSSTYPYEKYGFLTPLRIDLELLSKIEKISMNSSIYLMVKRYAQDCLIFLKSAEEIKSTDILSLIKNSNPSSYLTVDLNGNIVSCEYIQNKILTSYQSQKIKKRIANFLAFPLEKRIFLSETKMQDRISRYALLSALLDGLSSSSTKLNLSYLKGILEMQRTNFLILMGRTMAEYIPYLKTYLLLIIYFFLLFVPVFLLLYSTSVIRNAFIFSLSVFFYDPLLLLISRLLIISYQSVLNSFSDVSILGVPLYTLETSKILAVGGYLCAFSVPTLSFILARGFMASAESIALSFASHFSSPAQSILEKSSEISAREWIAKSLHYKSAGEMVAQIGATKQLESATSAKGEFEVFSRNPMQSAIALATLSKFKTIQRIGEGKGYKIAQTKYGMTDEAFAKAIEHSSEMKKVEDIAHSIAESKAFQRALKIFGSIWNITEGKARERLLSFADALSNLGFSEKQIEDILSAMASLERGDKKGVLQFYKKFGAKGIEETGRGMRLLSLGEAYGRFIAFKKNLFAIVKTAWGETGVLVFNKDTKTWTLIKPIGQASSDPRETISALLGTYASAKDISSILKTSMANLKKLSKEGWMNRLGQFFDVFEKSLGASLNEISDLGFQLTGILKFGLGEDKGFSLGIQGKGSKKIYAKQDLLRYILNEFAQKAWDESGGDWKKATDIFSQKLSRLQRALLDIKELYKMTEKPTSLKPHKPIPRNLYHLLTSNRDFLETTEGRRKLGMILGIGQILWEKDPKVFNDLYKETLGKGGGNFEDKVFEFITKGFEKVKEYGLLKELGGYISYYYQNLNKEHLYQDLGVYNTGTLTREQKAILALTEYLGRYDFKPSEWINPQDRGFFNFLSKMKLNPDSIGEKELRYLYSIYKSRDWKDEDYSKINKMIEESREVKKDDLFFTLYRKFSEI